MQPDPLPAAGETIGQRLKRLRLERGLSQRELAAPGVSYAYISRIEAGTRQPSVKALRRLAAKLGVTADYLETGSDLDQAAERELRLADLELAVRLQGDEASEQPLVELAAEAGAAGDHDVALRARFALASLAQNRGDHKRAVELLETTLAEHEPSPLEWVDFYGELGRAYAASGNSDHAVELYEHCLHLVSNSAQPNPTLEARYATLLSYALSDVGDLPRAEQVVKDALERMRDTEDSYMRVRLYWSLARLAHAENKPAMALANTRKAIALLEATEDGLNLARAHLLAAAITITRRDADEATAHLDAAERLLGRSPSFADAAALLVKRAQVAALRGDGDDAVTLSREAIAELGNEHPDHLGAAYAALGEGLGLQGEHAAADEAYRRAVDLLEEQRQWREGSETCRAWASLLQSSGRERQAITVLERAAELALRARPVHAER
jgi:transcriptional regulator with XRE-family HTH domain